MCTAGAWMDGSGLVLVLSGGPSERSRDSGVNGERGGKGG